MASSDTAYKVAAREGWTDETLLDVVLDYIDNQASDDAFRDYLEERSAVDEPEDEETHAEQ